MIQRFTNQEFAVSPDSDRMGVRFDDPELKREDNIDLISEAVAPGTIQFHRMGNRFCFCKIAKLSVAIRKSRT